MASSDRRVRPAVAADLPRLIAIDAVASGTDAVERQRLLRSAIDDEHCLVLSTASDVVGFVIIAPRRFFERDFIELMVIDASHRRTGAGRALLRSAVGQASSSRVFTSTNRSNDPMRRLLEAEGWTFSGELDGLDEGDPELVWFVDTND